MVKRARDELQASCAAAPAIFTASPQKRLRDTDESVCETLEVVASRCRTFNRAPSCARFRQCASSLHDRLSHIHLVPGDTITGTLLVDPVIAEDGHTYERRAIAEWFRRRSPATSPMTHEEIGTRLKENFAIRAIVEDLVSSPGLPRVERAEWHLSRGKLLCERLSHKRFSVPLSASHECKRVQPEPDIRAARKTFERAERLVEESCDDLSSRRVRDEARICREFCDRILEMSRLRDKATAAGIDVTWADGAYDAVFCTRGMRLSSFQNLARGTRVRILDDRRAVLAAFEAQDDVLGLPDDWEESLGREFVVENYDINDSTYVIVRPELFEEHKDNSKDGKWWPFSVVILLA